MTPLPRWVFLASLLASAACLVVTLEGAKDDACVRICRGPDPARETSGGVCEQRRLVPQSDGGRSAIQRLSRLCLITPCIDPVTTKTTIIFHHQLSQSEHCRAFRRFLVRIRKCNCDSLRHETTQGPASKDDSWLEELFEQYEKYGLNAKNVEVRAEAVLKKILSAADMSRPLEEAGLSLSGELSMMSLNDAEVDEEADGSSIEDSEEMEAMVSAGEDEEIFGSLDSKNSLEEPVDWEMWCMVQCDNGQGGSACNCDIIP